MSLFFQRHQADFKLDKHHFKTCAILQQKGRSFTSVRDTIRYRFLWWIQWQWNLCNQGNGKWSTQRKENEIWMWVSEQRSPRFLCLSGLMSILITANTAVRLLSWNILFWLFAACERLIQQQQFGFQQLASKTLAAQMLKFPCVLSAVLKVGREVSTSVRLFLSAFSYPQTSTTRVFYVYISSLM